MSPESKRPNRGRWQIERERCHIADRTPGSRRGESVPVRDAIGTVLTKLDLGEQVWLKNLESDWVELAGRALAKHARPGRYERRRLVVFVDSSAWLSELERYGRKELLEKLQQRFGADKIADLRLQMDPEGAQ